MQGQPRPATPPQARGAGQAPTTVRPEQQRPAAAPAPEPAHVGRPSGDTPDRSTHDGGTSEQRTPAQDMPEIRESGRDAVAPESAPARKTPEPQTPHTAEPGPHADPHAGPERHPERDVDQDTTFNEPAGAHHDDPQQHRPDEPYLNDPDFRTDRHEDFAAVDETHLDGGLIDDATGELRHEQVRREALDLRDANSALRHMSDDGAFAVHSYTRHDIFQPLNEALRTGSQRLAEFHHHARAIASGLNEMPPHEGPVVRGINHDNNIRLAELTAAHYEPGKIVVETQFTSTSKVTPDNARSAIEGEVELHIQSKTGRDISELASVKGEREVLLKPGTQLLVTDRRELDLPGGKKKWIIEAEEIGPDDPRYLDRDTAQRQIGERRARAAEDVRTAGSVIDSRLNPEGVPSHHVSRPDLAPQAQASQFGKPPGGWGELNRATHPPAEPAIHAGSAANPQQQVRFLRSQLSEVAGVNAAHYYHPDAVANGHRTNSAESVIAFERRMQGHDVSAAPLRSDVTHHRNLDAVQQELGGQWSHHGDFDSAIRQLADQPVGSRSVLAFEYQTTTGPNSHVVVAVNTEHGLALVDPRSGRLAQLPDAPSRVDVLPYHRTEGPVHDGRAHREPPAAQQTHAKPPAAQQSTTHRLDPEAGKREVTEHRAPDTIGSPQSGELNRSGEHQLGGASAREAQTPTRSEITDRLSPGSSDSESGHHSSSDTGYAGAVDAAAADTHPSVLDHTGDRDWSPLALASNPPSEPAIHAGTANDNQQARYVAERHPELGAVNPHYHSRNAFENGYQTNCTRAVVAYALRLAGVDAEAGPLLSHDMPTMGTREYVQQHLGGTWASHSDYDSAIRAMRAQPDGTHAVVAVKYQGLDGTTHGHVAMMVNTREGVAFVDPQTGRLMNLPHPPSELHLLPFQPTSGADAVAKPHTDVHPAGSDAARGDYGSASPEHSGSDGTSFEDHHSKPHQGSIDREETARYLAEPHVEEALNRANDSGTTAKIAGEDVPLGDAVRRMLPDHPELAALMRETGYLENSLLARPKTMFNLMSHPEAISVLEDAVHDVRERAADAGLADHEASGGSEPTPLTPEQNDITRSLVDATTAYTSRDQRQPGFDMSRIGDDAYREEYLRKQYEAAAVAQRELNEVAGAVAAETGGEPHGRPGPKDWARAMDKILGDYDGNVSRLVDLAGAKIQFDRVQDAYVALAKLSQDPRLEIVKFKDRFANPMTSGYRDLQMSVRMSNGHIAELRLHLRAIDDVAEYEHSLYEVSRDIKALDGEAITVEQRALRAALAVRVGDLFWGALQRGL